MVQKVKGGWGVGEEGAPLKHTREVAPSTGLRFLCGETAFDFSASPHSSCSSESRVQIYSESQPRALSWEGFGGCGWKFLEGEAALFPDASLTPGKQ